MKFNILCKHIDISTATYYNTTIYYYGNNFCFKYGSSSFYHMAHIAVYII